MKKILPYLLAALLSTCFSVQPIEDLSDTVEPAITTAIPKELLNEEFEKRIHTKKDGPNLIGYLDIKKEYHINQSTLLYVKYALQHYKKLGVSFVIVKINSLGGEIFQAAKIVDLFQKFDINEGVPLIAYLDEQAIATSAMLALGCRFIAVNHSSLMGGGFPGESKFKIEASSEKLRAFLKAEFVNLAKFYRRSPLLAEAMVDPYVVLVDRKGEIKKLSNESQIRLDREENDTVLTKEGHWLLMDSASLLKYGIADFEVEPETQVQRGLSKRWPFEKSPLSKQPYLATIKDATVVHYDNWKVIFLSFLTHPAVSSVLFVIVVLSFYLQINTPGFNASGGVGLIALGLLILCSFAIQAISSVVLILLALSICLILIEIFLIPGFGSVGILGIALCIICLFMLLLPGLEKFSLLDFESFTFAAGSLISRLVWLVCSMLFSFIAILLIKRLFQHKFINLKKRVLRKEQIGDLDFLERFEEQTLPKIHSIGITHCILRPIGKVIINDRMYEAITYHHETIGKKKEIVVVKHENGRVVVVENLPDEEKKV